MTFMVEEYLCAQGEGCPVGRCLHKDTHTHGPYEEGCATHIDIDLNCPISREEAPCVIREDLHFILNHIETTEVMRESSKQ
jgi:hypothetical protein